MANKFLPFVKWLFKKSELETNFHVGVLTASNVPVDSSLPTPPLSLLDSRDLFRFLQEKGLVFAEGTPDAFALNRVETFKWKETIKELKKPDWRRSWLYLRVTGSLFFIVVTFLSAYIGVFTAHTTELLYDATMKPLIERMSGQSPAKPTK